jgi:hypothetical protein
MKTYKSKIEYLEEQLEKMRELRRITEQQKQALERNIEENLTSEDVRASLMENISIEHSNIELESFEKEEEIQL